MFQQRLKTVWLSITYMLLIVYLLGSAHYLSAVFSLDGSTHIPANDHRKVCTVALLYLISGSGFLLSMALYGGIKLFCKERRQIISSSMAEQDSVPAPQTKGRLVLLLLVILHMPVALYAAWSLGSHCASKVLPQISFTGSCLLDFFITLVFLYLTLLFLIGFALRAEDKGFREGGEK